MKSYKATVTATFWVNADGEADAQEQAKKEYLHHLSQVVIDLEEWEK